ncbi:hypothetical protein ACT1UH_01115 [Mycoplasma sp. 332]|uniref:hypothetical protein n=1 Tax=unclassified Asterococcus (in: mycoplasmas, genus) TaxID=3407551 RepID=UPI003F659B24
MRQRFKNILIIRPILLKLLKDFVGLKNENGSFRLELDITRLELELSKKIANFEELRLQRLEITSGSKQLVIKLIKSLSQLDRSILLTILFKDDLSNITWKTFNISKSTFYRRLKFIESLLYWCLFD